MNTEIGRWFKENSRKRTVRRALGGALLLGLCMIVVNRSGAAEKGAKVPTFQLDPSWPKMPDNFKLGMITGVAVDGQDNVWLFHRPGSVKERAQAAPNVVEFNSSGKYLQGWGGPGAGYDWPKDQDEHGIFIDYQGNVWLCAGGGPDRKESQILKFSKTGKFLLQIGHYGQSKGSNDTENLSNAADVYVYPKTNEVFVADGYQNRRVIVFDATTGAFKRYWGAYGNKPDDSGERGSSLQQFAIVHHVRISNDGLVYVALRQQGRVQVFTVDGKYLKEVFLDKDSKDGTGVASLAFSKDKQQQFLYVGDLSKAMVHILNRQTLEEVGTAVSPGDGPGQLKNPHNIAVDSKGNLYVSELGAHSGQNWAGRIQKFVLKP